MKGGTRMRMGSSRGTTQSDQPTAGAGGAAAAGGALGFISGTNPATCTDDSFGCKLSHATNNLSMIVRIILLVVGVSAFLYFIWIFVRAKRSARK